MPKRFNTWESYLLPRQPGQSDKERVLRNMLGAATADQLAQQEGLVTALAVATLEAVPYAGPFDFARHRAVHRRIFGEVYE